MKDQVSRIIWQSRHEAELNWLKATQTLREGIELYPREMRLYDELGNLFFFKDVFDQAADCFEEAMNLDYRNADVIFKLAYCHLVNRDFEKAEYYFDMISEFIPEATYNKCVALYKLNKGYEAIELLEDLVESSNYSVKPYFLLGKLYLEYERFSKVFSLVEKGERIFGAANELYYIRGTAFFHTRQWLKAYVDFLKVEGSFTETPTFYRMFALTCEKIGKTEKAIELLLECIKKFPPFYGAYYDLIKIYILYKRYSEAIKIVDMLYKMGITLFEISGNEGSFFDSVFDKLKKNHD